MRNINMIDWNKMTDAAQKKAVADTKPAGIIDSNGDIVFIVGNGEFKGAPAASKPAPVAAVPAQGAAPAGTPVWAADLIARVEAIDQRTQVAPAAEQVAAPVARKLSDVTLDEAIQMLNAGVRAAVEQQDHAAEANLRRVLNETVAGDLREFLRLAKEAQNSSWFGSSNQGGEVEDPRVAAALTQMDITQLDSVINAATALRWQQMSGWQQASYYLWTYGLPLLGMAGTFVLGVAAGALGASLAGGMGSESEDADFGGDVLEGDFAAAG